MLVSIINELYCYVKVLYYLYFAFHIKSRNLGITDCLQEIQ